MNFYRTEGPKVSIGVRALAFSLRIAPSITKFSAREIIGDALTKYMTMAHMYNLDRIIGSLDLTEDYTENIFTLTQEERDNLAKTPFRGPDNLQEPRWHTSNLSSIPIGVLMNSPKSDINRGDLLMDPARVESLANGEGPKTPKT